MSEYETITYVVDDGLLTITLNRPDKLNAFNSTMLNELLDAFDRSDADDDVRAVIVHGRRPWILLWRGHRWRRRHVQPTSWRLGQ